MAPLLLCRRAERVPPEITIEVAGGKVSLTDAAGNTVNVIKTDVTGGNGVIHVIDGVLMPA